jgi:hypothetical protein
LKGFAERESRPQDALSHHLAVKTAEQHGRRLEPGSTSIQSFPAAGVAIHFSLGDLFCHSRLKYQTITPSASGKFPRNSFELWQTTTETPGKCLLNCSLWRS